MRERRNWRRRAGLVLLAGLWLSGPALAQDTGPTLAEPQPPATTATRALEIAGQGADLVFMRPLLAVATVVGAAAFVPVALVSAPQGKHGIKEAWQLLVVAPAQLAFTRPLGEF